MKTSPERIDHDHRFRGFTPSYSGSPDHFAHSPWYFHLRAGDSKGKTAAASTAEQRTSWALETAKANPLQLYAFWWACRRGGPSQSLERRDLRQHYFATALKIISWIWRPSDLPRDGATSNNSTPSDAGQNQVPALSAFNDQHLLRCNGECVFHAQLCAFRRNQRARSFL